MKTVFVGNLENEWLMHGALHYAYENIPDLDPVKCYTPHDVTKWSETLGVFIEGLDDDYLLLMLDDYWVQEYNSDVMDIAEMALNLSNIQKIDVSGGMMQFQHTPADEGFVLIDDTAQYRTSLQAAIWRKDYLVKFCKKGWTPWDFELKGSKMAKNDGATVLGVVRPAIRYINVLRRGEWYGQPDF